MERPDTTPLYFNGAIVVDAVQRKLDAVRAQYRRIYDRAFVLSQKGDDEKAQRMLDMANAALLLAEQDYEKARAETARAERKQRAMDRA